MKLSFKKIISSAAILSAASLLFAVETGGLISNDTKLANTDESNSLKLTQKNGINLWFRTPLNEDGKSYFTGEGAFRTEYDDTVINSDQKFKLALDVNLFKLVLHKELDSGSIIFSAGRFFNNDLTGIIYAQNGDGAKLSATFSGVEISAFAAFTGLLNAKNVTILEEKDHKKDEVNLIDKEKNLYVLANKYAIGAVTFSLPHIFASQTISFEGFGALSLESTKFNRFYATAALNGPIVSPIFYSLSSTFGFASYDGGDTKTGNLTQGAILFYPNFKSMSLSLNGLYASGKQGSFDSFSGFTSGTAINSTKDAEYSSLLKTGLSATIKPLSNLVFLAGGDLVFDASEDIKYAGIQYLLGLNYQAVSDVSLGINFSQYIGKDDFAESIGKSKTQLKINAAIAF
ncbi:hypothetical protein [Treponema sp.]|uniref:hypothetical protein n=1 Tax=Treponema sp. TaxID=166 RepID=UPI0025D6BA34|nr:hypothetical protein [Treponema sp.]MBR4322938.1 hypothetical protein [Treponema sp.]